MNSRLSNKSNKVLIFLLENQAKHVYSISIAIYWLCVQIAEYLICFAHCFLIVFQRFSLCHSNQLFDNIWFLFCHELVNTMQQNKWGKKCCQHTFCLRHVFESILQINTYSNFKMHRKPYNKSSSTMVAS